MARRVEEAVWRCPRCGFTARLGEGYYVRCPRCGSPLAIDYRREWSVRGGRGLSRYATLLPYVPRSGLGEGGTPLLRRRYAGVELLLKLEYLNPTGSFKDRGTALAIDYAARMGYVEAVEDSSGNTGISVAAYAAHYGMASRIVVPSTAPRGKKALIRALGAELVEARTRSDARALAETIGGRGGVFYVAHLWSPFYIHGAATIAYEVYEEAGEPDSVVVPFGSGGLYLGLYHGFKTLKELGVAAGVPRLHAVQGASVQPLYEAAYGSRVPGRSRLADGIHVAEPPRLREALEALRETRSAVAVVTDEMIVEALKTLYSWGLIVEPTSAAALAGLLELVRDGTVERGERVLLPLTGSGLKLVNEVADIINP